ncbi:MAG: single-stranded DNA-binding protein [Synergistaceae bacterium]|nr:single-stranded DNA-binding protein [Synergistaceae bacterium]MBQ7268057.1 single-stranded DNA-binding protein [Synergistaceae bacterium]
MRGFNRAIIAGNLTRDPDLRYTVNKRAYARFSVAVNYRYKGENGEYQEGTDYINVVAWGTLGETCGKYLKKGSPVLIEGRIRTGSYEARDGSGKRYTTEIMADNMTMLGSREQSGSSSGQPSSYQPSFGGYSPSDDDFGKSIGESGFGGTFSPGFADDDNSGIADAGSDSGIPF